MVAAAGVVVAGEITEAQARVDENGFPSTRVRVRVETPLKGDLGSEVTFNQFGGATASGRASVPGAPGYVPGEKVVLFLYPPSELGFSSPVGMAQGKLTVFHEGGRGYVRPSFRWDDGDEGGRAVPIERLFHEVRTADRRAKDAGGLGGEK